MRTRTCLLNALAALLLWTLPAQAQTNEVIERFTFMPPDAPETTVDPEGPFELILHRWSSDEERDALHESVTKMGGKEMLQALRGSGNVGRIAWPGGLTYNVRYARETTRADGSTDVVLVTDRPVWVWWDEAGVTPTTDYPFTVLQLRMSDGTGHGRSSLTTSVRADAETGVALGNEATTAIVMNDVKEAAAG